MKTRTNPFQNVGLIGLRAMNLFVVFWLVCGLNINAQNPSTTPERQSDKLADKSAEKPLEKSPGKSAEKAEDEVLRDVYRKFHDNYKLGANDEIAVRVLGQPEYSLEKAKISPVGRIFHPLLGDVEVAGRTVPQLTEELTKELSEYVLNPKVSISLLETRSAKIGVLGEVVHPGIFVMIEPMKVLDAITAAGGITEFGSKTSITVYRQSEAGQISAHEVNFKKLMAGKAPPQENLELQPGDTVMVNSNVKKKVMFISSLASLGSFMTLIGRGR